MSDNDRTTIIDLDAADFAFADEVAKREGGGGIRNCYACGACSAMCPVLPLKEDYDPRRIIRLVLLGQREAVLTEPFVWYCSTCASCQEVCPQGVNFTEVSFALKNMALEQGYFPAGLTAQVELLTEYGRLYNIGEFENDKRAKLGLPPMAQRPEDFKTMLEELSQRLKGLKAPAGREGES